MSKFQKFQKWSSVIPFWSTFFVTIVSVIVLKRHKASAKRWGIFLAILSVSVIAVFLLNTVIMTGQHPVLNVIASGLFLSIANVSMVDLQIKCVKEAVPADDVTQAVSEAGHPKKVPYTKVWVIMGIAVFAYIAVFILLSAWLTPSMDMEDTNGPENTSLSTLQMEDILTVDNHYSASWSSYSKSGSATGVTGKLEDCDYQECHFSCRKLNGVMTLQATKTMSDCMILECSSTLEEGNMEILVLVDGEVYSSIPVGQDYSIELSGISGKLIFVKVAAENAKMSISVCRTITKK